MDIAEKANVLNIFQQADEEGSGSVNKECVELFFQSCPLLDKQEVTQLNQVMKSYINPGTGGVEYKRFLDWLFEVEQNNGVEAAIESKDKPVTAFAPILKPALQKILLTEPAPAINRPAVVLMNPIEMKKSRLAKRRPAPMKVEPVKMEPIIKPEELIRGPAVEQPLSPTITGRDIAKAPAVAQVAAVKDDDFAPLIKKASTGGVGGVLEQFTSLLSEDIFGLPFSVSVAIPTIEDTPLIAISDGFTQLTGYSREDIVGRNCRFLLEGVPDDQVQDQTRLEARRYCRAAHLRGLSKLSHTFLIQRNARKNGELFWNLFMLAWVGGPDNSAFIVGLQLDLGPELNLAAGCDIAEAIKPHEQNLHVVLKMLFSKGLGQQIVPPEDDEGDEQKAKFKKLVEGMSLAEDIKDWIFQAESSSELFQQWGALPWTVWPSTTKYALMNGGTTVLRLEADETPQGGVAMSIFAVKKSRAGCSFKVSIDEVCSYECDVSKGGWLPCVGFTEVTPAAMDALGGLPPLVEATAQSVSFRGDGRVFIQSAEHNKGAGEAPCVEVACATPASDYVIRAGDTLEVLWGKGLFEVAAMTEEDRIVIYKLKDKAIPKPAKKPMHALLDCCHATCKATLLV